MDPRLARRGLGRRLIEECSRAADAAGFRSLELVATLPGEPLYAAAGFAVAERFELALPGDVRCRSRACEGRSWTFRDAAERD